MRSVTYQSGSGIHVVERPRRAPRTDEVEIEVAYTGLCGTDLHIVAGKMDARVPEGLVPGHEVSGVVARLGAGVGPHPAVGTRVSVVPLDWDGTCDVCAAGYMHICPNMKSLGIDANGSLQEFWSVPARAVVALPSNIPLTRAALLEPLAVAMHDVRRSEMGASDTVAIIGGGPIGALIALVAKELVDAVVVAEPSAWRQNWLRAAGVDALDPEELVEKIDEMTDGARASVVFEVSGSTSGARLATEVAAVRARIVIVGVQTDVPPFDLHRVFWRELTVIGARVYEQQDVAAAASYLTSATHLDALVSAVFPLEDAEGAFAATRGGNAMKVLIASRSDRTPPATRQ